MTRDLLFEATQALRDTAGADAGDSRATRARIVSTLRFRRGRRRVRALRWLPLAACIGTASAWAATKPVLPALWNDTVEVLGIRKPVHEVPRPSIAQAVRSTHADTPMTAPAIAETPATAVSTVETPKAHRRALASTSGVDREHELYRAAHHAHFVAQDPAAALTAWDAYLAGAPTGRFAIEARYNRALCLVRLGRTDAARTALTPFADGAFGDYRQREAVELLRALTDR
jgi:hypothetical protein